jgi:sugar O-acyltransferase (sialic acid O-acetyltransferase NeuD family)
VTELLIFGVGKVADVVYHHLTRSADYSVAAFTCDAAFLPEPATFRGLPVIAFEEAASRYPPNRFAMIVAVGYHELNAARRRKYEEAKALGYDLVSYISPRACVDDQAAIGDNCIVLDNAVVEPGVTIGSNAVIWSSVLVGHHSVLEDDVWIAGQATLGGSVRLGARSFVGLGAIVAHEVELGAQCFVGAGTLVTKCAPPKSVFIAKQTEIFRLDSDRFLKISKLR